MNNLNSIKSMLLGIFLLVLGLGLVGIFQEVMIGFVSFFVIGAIFVLFGTIAFLIGFFNKGNK